MRALGFVRRMPVACDKLFLVANNIVPSHNQGRVNVALKRISRDSGPTVGPNAQEFLNGGFLLSGSTWADGLYFLFFCQCMSRRPDGLECPWLQVPPHHRLAKAGKQGGYWFLVSSLTSNDSQRISRLANKDIAIWRRLPYFFV